MNPGGAWGWVQETPPDCLIILIFGTIWFIIYYADQFKRWGTLSIGAWLIGFDFYLKIIFMYPFAYSKENMHDVAQKFYIILAHLDQALRISAVGALAMMFGMLISGARQSDKVSKILDSLHDVLLRGWCNSRGATVAGGLVLGITVLLLGLGFKPFVARDMVFDRPDLRPIYNLWSQLVPFAAICIGTYGLRVRSSLMVAIAASIGIAGGLFGGNRTMTVFTLVQLWIIWSMPDRRRSLLLPLGGAGALAILGLMISTLRGDGGSHSSQEMSGLDELLYGSNFSDLRDFAWILSGLYDHYYMGLTYLAGYLAFIPTFLLDFRYTMAFGRVSTLLAGLDPSRHGGLRPPLFGELYVNFAYPGVVLGGAAFGVLLGKILGWVSRALEGADRGRYSPHVAVLTGFLAYDVSTTLIFTPGFYFNYVLAALIGTGLALARWRPLVRLPSR